MAVRTSEKRVLARFPSVASLLASLVASFLAGCSVTPPQEINDRYREILGRRFEQYVLKENDKLRIEFSGVDPEEENTLNQQEILVLPDGTTDLWYLPNYRLAGKSIEEVRAEIRRNVSEKSDIDLTRSGQTLRIQVIPAPEHVYMVGQFTARPARETSQIPLSVRMTLQEAISYVDGLRVTGDTDWALLRRPYVDPLHPDLFRIDLNDWSEDIYLLPGDQIVLQRNFAAAVVNYIKEFVFGIFPSQLVAGAALAGL